MTTGEIIQETVVCYALSVKGGYYDMTGEITYDPTEAFLFRTKEEAIAYRTLADKAHKIEQSILLRITWLVEDCDV